MIYYQAVNDSAQVLNVEIQVLAQMLTQNTKINENFMPVDGHGSCPSKCCQNENTSLLKSNFNSVLQNRYLMILNLSHANLRTIPRDVKKLKCLVWLDVSHNQIDVLPSSLSDIPHLRYLNLSHNNFHAVPYVFQTGLQFIRVLDISFNIIMNFDEHPCCSFNLEELNISHNKLNQIPSWIFNRTSQLKKLDISNNILGKMTGTSFLLNNLTFCIKNLCYLNLEDCKLTENELFFISHMTDLETLQIGNTSKCFKSKNHFESLNTKTFEKCSRLSNVSANNIGLSVLPNDFGSLNHIRTLNLEHNFLTWLPDSFTDLNSLEVCRLSHNSLCFLPTEFGKLVSLRKLFLNNNSITELPNSFNLLVNLEHCDLYCNGLKNFDSKIIMLKSMKGIDLECNNLNFHAICTSQEEYKEFSARYQTLKEEYRNCVSEERCDGQIMTGDDSETEQFERDNSSDVSPGNFVDNDILQVEESPNPENWDAECGLPCFSHNIDPDSDDDFDPNVNYEEELKKKGMSYRTSYEGNFCPSKSHVTSLRKYFLRKPDNDPAKDQYDSN